ncbi:hypothetical protein [Macrococcus epidermidis]|uniref:hypothetical protein n=1 Tax=Macrococcus epidermidis TaxID=1902580 RepID=UPI0020B6D18A|nr:hypothetical protein [Macrococcus epidermidis]UTH16171.1 hypothetical protein KFV12_13115 [Macrococcus epidermidis]
MKAKTLNELLKDWQLDYDKNMVTISSIIGSQYKLYIQNPVSYESKNQDISYFENLLRACEGIKPQLIPYNRLTEIIFNNDMSDEYMNNEEINESNFGEIFQRDFEKYLEKKFEVSQLSFFPESSILINEYEISKYRHQIEIVYKLIEHIKLAISQKNGLFVKQSKKIHDINSELQKAQVSYESMITNFISILGIFAGILMAAFGSIQGFTAIYKSTFSLVDSIILACVGFIGVQLLLFLLMNSIAKLTDRSLDSTKYMSWYLRHRTIANSFILMSTIVGVCICFKVTMNPPVYNKIGWIYLLPIIYMGIMIIIFNRINPIKLLNVKEVYRKWSYPPMKDDEQIERNMK